MSWWSYKDYLRGTCTNSFCEKWHPPVCLFYKTKSGCRFGEKCSYAHRQVDEQPTKRTKTNGDKSAVALLRSTRQLDCVFQDMEPQKSSSILRESSDMQKPILRVFSRKLLHVTLKFETKILRSEIFVQVNLMSVAPTLRNLRIGFRRRDGVARARCPRSSVEAGLKCVKNKRAPKSNILLTFGK